MLTTAYICLLVAGLLPLVCTGIAKAGFRQYDNSQPRQWLSRQTGFRARASAAEANSLEAFALFAVALLAAIQTGVDAELVNRLAVTFVITRLLYIGCYVADKATLRSAIWAVGYGASIALAVFAIRAA
jgi:uncharacterized MAPEG superfamily protein